MNNELVSALNATLSFEKASLDALHSVMAKVVTRGEEQSLVEAFLMQCPDATIVECATELSRSMGPSRLAEVLVSKWGRLTEIPRLKIAMTAGATDVLSDQMWLSVFESPSNSVHVRHRILAGLVSSHSKETWRSIPELLSCIGTYDDPNRQAVLDRFSASVRSRIEKGSSGGA